MSGGELIVIFHYDGEFKFDMIHPVYEGEKQNMRYIQSDITFSELVNIALESSHWEETCENLSIHYLHHNGHVFSLAAIEDDSDIKCMLTVANQKANEIYLYINKRSIRSATHIGEHIRSFGMDIRSTRGKQPDCSGRNHNVKCKVPPVESHEIPTVNLREDNDIHFSEGLEHNSSREMWLGRKFPNRDEFRRTLAKFAIYNNFTLQHLKTQQFKVTAQCKECDCPWRIHASMIESGPHFKVRTYNPTHKCSKPMMGTTHRQTSSELIAEYILEKVHLNHNIRPKEIMNDYQMEFSVTISYRKEHMAKDIALCIVRGSYEDSFKILPLYCEELKMMNPSTVTNIETSDDDKFKRFVWSFGPCIRSFTSSLRPMVAVDGTHLRGKYPGVLMVSVTLDANHKLFPIAFVTRFALRLSKTQ